MPKRLIAILLISFWAHCANGQNYLGQTKDDILNEMAIIPGMVLIHAGEVSNGESTFLAYKASQNQEELLSFYFHKNATKCWMYARVVEKERLQEFRERFDNELIKIDLDTWESKDHTFKITIPQSEMNLSTLTIIHVHIPSEFYTYGSEDGY